MKIYSIPKHVLDSQYKGCGRAWVAVDTNGNVVAMKYMHDHDGSDFGAFRLSARAALGQLGDVVGGMASCCEFVSN